MTNKREEDEEEEEKNNKPRWRWPCKAVSLNLFRRDVNKERAGERTLEHTGDVTPEDAGRRNPNRSFFCRS